jgi:hypothetical protein
MEEYGYMLKIFNYLGKSHRLKEEDFQLLSVFTFNPQLNANNITDLLKEIENGEEKIAYPNVNERVKRLNKLGLIELVDTIDNRKRKQGKSTLYKLSEEGLFAFLYDFRIYYKISSYYWSYCKTKDKDIQYSQALTYFRRSIYRTNQDSDFFKFFLYTWISNDTVTKLSGITLLKVGRYLSNICKTIKNHFDFYKYGRNETRKKDPLDGYDNFIYARYYDFTQIKGGDYLVDKEPLLNFTNKIFSFGDDKVRVNRMSRIEVVVSNSRNPDEISLRFLEKQKRLEIAKTVNNHKESISIPAPSIERVEINIMFSAILHQIFDSMDINDAIGTIMLSRIEESDLELLGKDNKFMSYLKVQKEIYNANCNKLISYDSSNC